MCREVETCTCLLPSGDPATLPQEDFIDSAVYKRPAQVSQNFEEVSLCNKVMTSGLPGRKKNQLCLYLGQWETWKELSVVSVFYYQETDRQVKSELEEAMPACC